MKRKGDFILYKSVSSPSSSFLHIIHGSPGTHFSHVFILTEEFCAVCVGRQGQEMLSLTTYHISAFSFLAVTNFSLANPFILSRN